jgi:hypothetical protein
MDTSARRRVAEGAAATDQATGRLQARAADLLSTAFRAEETASSERAPTTNGGTTVPPAFHELPGAFGSCSASGSASAVSAAPHAASQASQNRIERALALVERIERFVRSGRPSLALTLRGGMAGELEVERVARGAVALRLSSSRPLSANALGELRQALEARGLSVRSLEARRLTAESAIAVEAEKRGGRGTRVR